MYNKTDSEVTSLAESSPARSPRRAAYYVQSPSRESSHDGEKAGTTASFHSTPVISPMGSPPHSQSSSSRFSAGSRKPHRKGPAKPWKECAMIEEEGLLEGEDGEKGIPRRCYLLAFVLGFVFLFSIFSLILWGASRPQKPRISMKSITFETFVVQAGTDSSGVPTDMVSMNSTVKLTFRNTATFFGIHVTSTSLDLSYSDLSIATGTMKQFYQSRKSQRTMNVVVQGSRIPLYGGGAGWGSSSGKADVPLPLKLSFMVRSRAYVLGKLVKPKFYVKVDCSVTLRHSGMNRAVSLRNACQYS